MNPRPLCLALATTYIVAATQVTWASPYTATGEYFVQPSGWNVGASGSTFQAWDNLVGLADNAPDAGYTANPAIDSGPTFSGTAPAFATGTGNLYSFSGPYTASADIYNYSSGGATGTHIIVQTGATLNEVTVVPGSLEIVDLSGAPLSGGDSGSALINAGRLAAGTVESSQGLVDYEVLIWEFYLPDYTGDFRVRWDEVTDSSFDQLRVDSYITAGALPPTPYVFTQIPEPSTLAVGLLILVRTATSRRNHDVPVEPSC